MHARPYRTNEEVIEEDVPEDAPPGWRAGSNYYQDYNRVSNRVDTRPADYVPYQSFTEPGGPHAGRQNPQRPRDELRSGRVVQTAEDRRNQWNAIRPNPVYHPPGATVKIPCRSVPRNMPPPAPHVGGQGQPTGSMQHNPIPVQRPVVAAGSPTYRSGPPPQLPYLAPAQGPMQGPPLATRGRMAPPPLPQAGVRGRGSDPNLRSATGEYGNSEARGSRGSRGGRR